MSDTISTPTAAPAAPPTPAPAPAAPPPNTQQGLSVSEAGRLLSQQRRQAGGGQPQPQPERREAPRPLPRQAEAPSEAAAPAAPAVAESTPASPLDSMAKALGLPNGVNGVNGAAPSQESTPAATDGYEIEGRRYTAEQLRNALGQSENYTQRMQQLAEQTRQLQAQQEALATVMPYIQPELARVQQQISDIQPPNPALVETDPQGYLRAMAHWQAAQQEQQRLGQLTQLQQQAAARAMAQQVQDSNEALAKQYKEWADPAVRAQWQQQIANWAMDKGGYSRDELRVLTDHRQLNSMMKAMLWDNMIAGSKTQAPSQAPPARGQAPPPRPAQAISAADQAFTDKPSLRNATALLTARRAGER